MPLTPSQIAAAAAVQSAAAHDLTTAIRVLAGPGTGKSRCIEERVAFLITQGVSPSRIVAISFTRASANDLQRRISAHFTAKSQPAAAALVRVSTMHSLALTALRKANLLTMFPTQPTVMDEWEQREVFDAEFAETFNVTPTRAKEIRAAYDAYWQTLQGSWLTPITNAERTNFQAFYRERTTMYSCILPGEVVRRCVDAIGVGQLTPATLLTIDHLIVDEFQDLNACDQQFVQYIATGGAQLWVAGDDDQSIYSFRHAAPSGIQDFATTYPGSSTHFLSDCFRCTPAVTTASTALIGGNPSPPRINKGLTSLYAASAPPVAGRVEVWRLADGGREARVIAESCASLIAAGLAPSDIVILVANSRAQLPLIEQELRTANVAYTAPKGPALRDTELGRVLLAVLRIVSRNDDHAAHRDLLGVLEGVGIKTCLSIASSVVANNLGFLDVFHAPLPTGAFSKSAERAALRTSGICQPLANWNMQDTLLTRDNDIINILGNVFSPTKAKYQSVVAEWQALRASLPDGMTLDELLAFTSSDNEVEQLRILQDAQSRLGLPPTAGASVSNRVRVLTMHGAKGLEGKVVFIPGFELGIIPSRRALSAAGLMQESRRLLYVSITRASIALLMQLGGISRPLPTMTAPAMLAPA